MILRDLIRLARPHHWIKNVIVLFPVLFAQRAGDLGAWIQALVATAALCLASSAIYAVNDIVDREKDRLHPRKSSRPLAAGRVGVRVAAEEAAVLLAAAMVVGRLVGWLVLAILVAYVLLQLAYSYYLKRKMILDVICIALGFVLRASAGAVAIGVAISPWLFVCTFAVSLFMGFCKRYNEISTLPQGVEGQRHRATLAGYAPMLLTHLVTLSGAITIIAYLLYAASSRTVANLGTYYLVYALPVVIYGVCRFAMLSMMGSYSDPTDLILHDAPFQLTVLLWGGITVIAILYGRGIHSWLARFQ